MQRKMNRKSGRQKTVNAIAGFMIPGLMLLNSGCGQSEPLPVDESNPEPPSPSVETSEPRESVSTSPAAQPAVLMPQISGAAPVLRDIYPTLTSGALRLARLTELSDNVLLQAEGVSITQEDLEKELAQAPVQVREQMRRNAFFLLEQKAAVELLTKLAEQRFKDESLSEERLLQRYFEDLTRNLTVTDTEIESFYQENPDLIGDRPLEEIKEPIRGMLQQQKQQEAVETHIADLGGEMTIALSGKWVQAQAALAVDNPVDQARASGKPTFVNFGAKGCIPCDQMEPIREEIKSEYEGKLNVVFVHVNRDQILASRYGVRGIPHLVFFDNEGKAVHSHTGFMPKEQIKEWVKKIGMDDA